LSSITAVRVRVRFVVVVVMRVFHTTRTMMSAVAHAVNDRMARRTAQL